MLFDLPDPQTLYAALVARDPSYEGRAYVGVKTTGIFCRLTCPARNPLPQNCTFLDSPGACIEAGFRPCKRCKPLDPIVAREPVIGTLLTALEARPDRRWRETDVAAMGLDPSTVRRAFRRHFGISFLEMARQRRLRAGFRTLADTGSVIAAQLDAGFESPAAFRAAFARLLGVAPGKLAQGGPLRADWIDTPLGAMIAVSSAHALHLLEFADRKALPTELKRLAQGAKSGIGIGRHPPTDQVAAELAAYFAGNSARFTVPLAPTGTEFSQTVWRALQDIPAGQTRSYGALAKAIGRPTASRAVARANGANPIALVIPCHRVIGADGTLTGYGGGLWRKQRLIDLERQYAKDATP